MIELIRRDCVEERAEIGFARCFIQNGGVQIKSVSKFNLLLIVIALAVLSAVVFVGLLSSDNGEPAYAMETGQINVSTTTYDTEGDGWTWVYSTKTLTINNLHLAPTDANGVIYLPGGSTLELVGENRITAANNKIGIVCKGNLNITGAGTLLVTTKGGTGIMLENNSVVSTFTFDGGYLDLRC